jgi:hypothetical protein
MSFELGDYVKYYSYIYQIVDIEYAVSRNINHPGIYVVSQNDIIHEDGTDKPFKIGDYVLYTKTNPPMLVYIRYSNGYRLRGVNDPNNIRFAYPSEITHIDKEEKSAKFLAFGNGKFKVGDYVHYINPINKQKCLYQIVKKNRNNRNNFILRNVDKNLTIWWIPGSEIERAIINKGEKTAKFLAFGNGNFEVGDYVQFTHRLYKGLFQIIHKSKNNEFRLRNVNDNSTIGFIPESWIRHAIIKPGEKSAQFRAIGKVRNKKMFVNKKMPPIKKPLAPHLRYNVYSPFRTEEFGKKKKSNKTKRSKKRS